MRRGGPARRRGRAGLWSFCEAPTAGRPRGRWTDTTWKASGARTRSAAGRPLQLRSPTTAGKMAAELRAGALRRSGPTHPGDHLTQIPKFGIVLVVVLVLGALGFRDRKETDVLQLICSVSLIAKRSGFSRTRTTTSTRATPQIRNLVRFKRATN
jgi:hypothetical protein